MRRRPGRLAPALAALFFLWALFVPAPGAGGIAFDGRPSAVLALVLAVLALAGWTRRGLGRGGRIVLAALVLVLALLQFAAAEVAHVLDRPLDLYFDLRQVPNLLSLYLDAAGRWHGGAVIGGIVLALAVGFFLTLVAVGALERALVRPAFAATGVVLAIVLGTLAAFGTGAVDADAFTVASRQIVSGRRAFAVLHGYDRRYDAVLAVPQPQAGPLPGLAGHDVFLIFVESYGTVVLDQPPYRARIEPALEAFAKTVNEAGYALVSSRVVSPTFGGGSWLAHGTIASGVKLDLLLDELVINGSRMSLPRYMKAAGYGAVEVMPGIKDPYPEAAFWGFDRNYFAKQLAYDGPEFGWFDIPDQYTLRQFASAELAPGHAPLFAQIVLVSSHTPFAPVPPYLDDWSDAGRFKTVPQADWPKIYAQPDWNDLDQPYLDSIAYDLKTLGAWLAGLPGAPLVIVLGDHQPPDLTLGAGEAWTVPIHILSRDADLVKPFAALGYGAGAVPPPLDRPEGMENFLGEFLAAFRAERFSSAPPQSLDARASSPP